jgi:lipoprotein-anchoring transpeptidase ErfK/SrfK
LLTALGALAAVAAVVAGFALLFSVLDEGGSDPAAPATTVVRVRVPGGQTADGRQAKPGHAAVGTKAPESVASPEGPPEAEASPEAEAPPEAGGGVAPEPVPARTPTLRYRPVNGPASQIAHVIDGQHVDLQAEPGGPVLVRIGGKTEFGSPELPNGELGWIARDPAKVQVYWTRYSLHADLGTRTLELRYGNQAVRTFEVTIGGAGTETPPGRYGVTDGVSFDDSPYYGCCALALSGHQTAELPPGWIGGNRLAIHGTPGAVGGAESLGCIRATDETMRYLFARVPLGAPVYIDS